MKPVTIYGIPNCDTMKKARAWLDGHGVAYDFHDYKKAGIDRQRLESWSKKVGWETLLNRAGTTFRKLPDADKQGVNERTAIDLMLAQPSLIKRPVLDLGGGKLLVGFKPEVYDEPLSGAEAHPSNLAQLFIVDMTSCYTSVISKVHGIIKTQTARSVEHDMAVSD